MSLGMICSSELAGCGPVRLKIHRRNQPERSKQVSKASARSGCVFAVVCRIIDGNRFQVRLSRKIDKLFSRELLPSVWEHICRWTHPVSPRKILATIDRHKLAALPERYPARAGARKINAYEDAAYWVGVNVRRVQDLWLDRATPLRIFDLGSGPGYFLYICRLFGHEGLGLDTDENPLFRGTTELFNVPRVIARISPQTPLPEIGKKFDLVTASAFPGSNADQAENGGSGQRPIGDSLSATFARDFLIRTAACSSNSIRALTAHLSSRRSCAPASSTKARASSAPRRFLERMRLAARTCNRGRARPPGAPTS